jgi:hypothetical protein
MVVRLVHLAANSLFGWLVADGWCWFVLREEYCWLVADDWFVLREKYCCLVADKPSGQGGNRTKGIRFAREGQPHGCTDLCNQLGPPPGCRGQGGAFQSSPPLLPPADAHFVEVMTRFGSVF